MFKVTKEVIIDKANGIDYSKYSHFTKFISGYSKVFDGVNEYYIDKNGLVVDNPILSEVTEVFRKLVLFKTDDGMGYKNLKGKVVIKPVYSYAFDFNGSYAVVKKDKWGVIGESGKEIVPCICSNVMDMDEGMVYVDSNVYDINKIKLKYLLHISYNDKVITKEFDNLEMLEFYKKALFDSLFNIISLTSDEIIDDCMIKKRRK